MKILALSSTLIAIAGAAFAGDSVGVITPSVPEIDALSGLAAMAVVGGAVTLLWERRRRK